MLNWIDNRLVAKGFEILSSLLLPVYKLSRENTQPEKMCNVFEKAKRRAGKVNRTSAYAEAAVRSVL